MLSLKVHRIAILCTTINVQIKRRIKWSLTQSARFRKVPTVVISLEKFVFWISGRLWQVFAYER